MSVRVTHAHQYARWRTGRKLGRTVYAMWGPEPSDDDVFVGIMETRELAAQVVAEHNAQRRRV